MYDCALVFFLSRSLDFQKCAYRGFIKIVQLLLEKRSIFFISCKKKCKRKHIYMRPVSKLVFYLKHLLLLYNLIYLINATILYNNNF